MVWGKYIQRNIALSAYNVYKMSYDEYEKVNVQLDKHTINLRITITSTN